MNNKPRNALLLALSIALVGMLTSGISNFKNIPVSQTNHSSNEDNIRTSSYYKEKGYQIFKQYQLAVKAPCKLEDVSNQSSDDFDLNYGGIENPTQRGLKGLTSSVKEKDPPKLSEYEKRSYEEGLGRFSENYGQALKYFESRTPTTQIFTTEGFGDSRLDDEVTSVAELDNLDDFRGRYKSQNNEFTEILVIGIGIGILCLLICVLFFRSSTTKWIDIENE